MDTSTEAFLARLINLLSDQFKDHLVLKGGMQLRLLNSPRSTQDIDFVWLSRESKKILAKLVRNTLSKEEDIVILKESLNSRGIFISVEEKQTRKKAILELNVLSSTHLPPEPLSTAPIASRHALSARVISTMAIPESFSHKICACLEREAARDLYDLSLFEPMEPFDEKTLRVRLSSISIKRQKPKKLTLQQAGDFLRQRLQGLTELRLKEELYPLLPPENRGGLLRVIQASVGRITQKLENL